MRMHIALLLLLASASMACAQGALIPASPVPVTQGGTGCSAASITCVNNISGGSLAGTLVGTSDTQTLTNKSIAASQLTGSVAAAQMPAFTGDVTSSAGTVATTVAKIGGVSVGTAATANAGTGIGIAANAINSNATEHLDYQPGLITSITNTKSVFAKLSKTSTVDNLEGSASAFTCVGNPTVTMYECGTSATCASSPVTIGTVTVTAAGTVVDGTVSAPAITAGDYVAWAISAGTCTSLDISAVAQVHAN